MNIVQVRLVEDKNAKRYTYRVPENLQLKKNDVVRTKNINGKECIAICITDSENLSENAIDMIMSGNEVKSDIIGIYEFKNAKSNYYYSKIHNTLMMLVNCCGYKLSYTEAFVEPYNLNSDKWILEKEFNGHINRIFIDKNNTSYNDFVGKLIKQYTDYNDSFYACYGNEDSFREIYGKDIEDIGILQYDNERL